MNSSSSNANGTTNRTPVNHLRNISRLIVNSTNLLANNDTAPVDRSNFPNNNTLEDEN